MPLMSTHRFYSDLSDSERFVTQEADTVAAVKTMHFAGHGEVEEASRPVRTCRSGAGSRRTPPVGLGRAVANPEGATR